jgi:hypothetical protein
MTTLRTKEWLSAAPSQFIRTRPSSPIEMHQRMKKFKLFSLHFLTGAFAKGRVVVSLERPIAALFAAEPTYYHG